MNFIQITTECVNWCEEQHFVHSYRGIWIVLAALCCLSLFLFASEWYNSWGLEDEKKNRIMINLIWAAWLLLFGFFVWFRYFR